MINFALAVFFLIITPGPGVLSVAGVASGYGCKPAISYLGGLCLGNNLVIVAVVSGLAAAMFAVPGVRTLLLYASVLYLVYLALRIALAGSRVAFITSDRAPGFVDGMTLQFINPKAYAVNTALFSGFAFAADQPLFEVAVKIVIVNAIWTPLHFLWLWAGLTINRLELPHKVQRHINYAMAGSMLVVVGLAVWANIS